MSKSDRDLPPFIRDYLSGAKKWSKYGNSQLTHTEDDKKYFVNIENNIVFIEKYCLDNSITIPMEKIPNKDLGNTSLSDFQSEKEYYEKEQGKIGISLDEFNILNMEIQDGTKRYLFFLTNKNDEKTKKVKLPSTVASYLYCLGIKKNTPPEDWEDIMKENTKILEEIQSVFAGTLKKHVIKDIECYLPDVQSSNSTITHKSWISAYPNTISKTASRINRAFNKEVINHKKDKEAYLIIPDETTITSIYTLHPSIKKFIPPK